jgi:putative heme-binding domain-containing protein
MLKLSLSATARAFLGIAVTVLAFGTTLAAQADPEVLAGRAGQEVPKNPYEGKPEAIKDGMVTFRGECAFCHGIDAKGARGPDLTAVFAAGATDQGVFQTIKRGVPGTQMPPASVFMNDDLIWKTIMYLRTLAAPAPSAPERGNAENGKKVFDAKCATCHRVNTTGGVLGPELTRVGARSRELLVRRIRGAVEESEEGYKPVTLVTPEGRTIRGAKKNEDLFSVQIMDTRERIQGYTKSTLRGYANGTRSLMPVYGPERLSETELDDLLKYLDTLRGFDPVVR